MTVLKASVGNAGGTHTLCMPGDKSISHRALIIGALALGTTHITGLLEGDDILSTIKALRQLGVTITQKGLGNWIVEGRGNGGLGQPNNVIDFGNSGTAARLLMGVLGAHDFRSIVTGDDSLRVRPMSRVITPLRQMGAQITAIKDNFLPIVIEGDANLLPFSYEVPVPSAQVKSCILLAGLLSQGKTTVIEKIPTRDHTERMLSHFGAKIDRRILENKSHEISIFGGQELKATTLDIPGDPSSAAFFVAAGLLRQNTVLHLKGIGVNHLRTGFFDVVKKMGADITYENKRIQSGEPVADLRIVSSKLKGVDVPAHTAPFMIDEYPILCVLAAFAKGETIMHGLAELRLKESDRLSAMEQGLKENGINVKAGPDWIKIKGQNEVAGGGIINAPHDHRIAMSFLVMGLATQNPICVRGAETIKSSFPNFQALINSIGGRIETAEL